LQQKEDREDIFIKKGGKGGKGGAFTSQNNLVDHFDFRTNLHR
jgi:hypothetical protein